jgi:DNA mismatch repair protein MutH
MSDKNKWSKEEILDIADSALGKTFKDFKFSKNNNKGGFGHTIEEELFEYAPNPDAEPDFKEANIELKVTPYKKNKNGTFSAKERLVLNIINYMQEHHIDFYSSSFWSKNQQLLILFYLHVTGRKKEDFRITHRLFYDYPKEDFLIIKQDWEKIVRKIELGLAHEISEADTMYLAACTKGQNKRSLRKQPFSNIKAKQRAYSFKQSYMTQLIRQMLNQNNKEERLLNYKELEFDSFENVIIRKLSPYFGKSAKELFSQFGLKTTAKSKYHLLIGKMLGISGSINNAREFIMANIVPKTIRIEENDTIKEHMSFPAFKFKKIAYENWDSSEIRELFETTKFMFIVFRKINGYYYFEKVHFWNMPLSILDKQVKDVWKETKNVILDGSIVGNISKTGKRKTNFPGSTYNHICHIRPHARDANDTYDLPVADKLTSLKSYTKQCFWLDRRYIKEIIS